MTFLLEKTPLRATDALRYAASHSYYFNFEEFVMELNDALYFEDLAVGSVWLSEPCEVSQQDIFDFAELSGDHNPIHVDPEFAKGTPFRRCIAHGILGLSIAGGLSTAAPRVRTLALVELREWKFLGPIFPGDQIHIRNTVLDRQLRPNGKRGMVVWRMETINQAGKVVQDGTLSTIVEAAAAGRLPKSA
jgi:acyl dehydratase